VPEDGLGCLNDVENKAGGSREQHSSAREGPLTPPLLPTPEATPTPAQNILARQITPGAFPDDDSTTDALPTSPQVSVQVPIQARTALPAPDPSSPSWALQESLQQAAAKPVRRSARLNPTADAGSGGEDIADALDTADAAWWPGSEVSQSNIITRKRTRICRDNPDF
jgi:hypothetical protein